MRYVNSFVIIVQSIKVKVVQHDMRYHKLITVASVFMTLQNNL